jgi:hypothetical protein
MEPNERTLEVYEEVGGYPKPPLIPLPDIEDLSSMERMGLRITPLSRKIIRTFMSLSGFRRFYKNLPDNLEKYMRRDKSRLSGLFLPLISATLTLTDDPRHLTPAQRAATLIFGARNLYDDLWSGKLPGDEYKGHPLEMGQYPNLFSTSLIVEKKRKVRLFKSVRIDQITVIVCRRIYIMDIGDLSKQTTPDILATGLQNLINLAKINPLLAEESAPGFLTGASHQTQFNIFPRLRQIPINAESLEALKHSFLTVCFDLDFNPNSDQEMAFFTHAVNHANRWYHSSLQLVIFGNSKACAICNFTTHLDGNNMMRGASEIQKRGKQINLSDEISGHELPLLKFHELKWRIHPEMIRRARMDLVLVSDNQPATFDIDKFGRKFFTSHQLEAVPTFILALQMTANHLVGKPVQITQFLTLSRYRCMDLITGMVSTPEVLAFTEAILNSVNRELTLDLLKKAIESQGIVARKARQYLNMPVAINQYFTTQSGLKLWYTTSLYGVCLWLLTKLKLLNITQREVLVSHPEIYPEISIVGRPGVRLPYVSYFGLHYQIWDEKTVITMMPAVRWPIPNVELIAELKHNLEKIAALVED